MQKIIFFLIGGIVCSLVGLFVGLLVGMTIGGNYDPPFYYGGLPGYEGAGLLGSILGLALALWVWINRCLKDSLRSHGRIFLLLSTVVILIGQDVVARKNGTGLFPLMLLPIASQGLLVLFHRSEEF